MIVVDVNVLLAAFRADHAHHPMARPWLERTLSGNDSVLVPDLAWVGFLRLVTNTHIFDVPSTPAEAFEFVDAVCAADAYAGIPGLNDGLAAFRDAVLDADAWGNLIPDAYLASVALTHAAPIASFDRDFRRFDGLKIIIPAA